MNYNTTRRKSNKFLQQKRMRDGPDVIELDTNENKRKINKNKSFQRK